jgi:hypothetical protein
MARVAQMRHSAVVPVEVNLGERWLKLGDPSGSMIQIWGSREPGYNEYGFVDFRVAITGAGLDAESSVQTMEDGLPNLRSFFRDLAADWRGLNGDSAWEAIEHDLTIEGRHDPLGHVLLTFVLRENYKPRAWQVRATVQLEAGEEMTKVADAIYRLIPGV